MEIKVPKYISFLLIAIGIGILIFLTNKISYAYFYSISSSNIYSFKAGNLDVVANTTVIEKEEFYPSSIRNLPTNVNSLVDGDYVSLNIQNNGNLKAEYLISLSKDKNNVLDLNNFNIAVYDNLNNKWLSFQDKYYLSLENEDNNFLFKNTISVNEAHNYKIYLWLKEDISKSEIGKDISVKVNIQSLPTN